MAYESISGRNMSRGVVAILEYVSDIEPLFVPLTVFVIFLSLSLGSYWLEKGLRGKGNFLGSLAAGGFSTTVIVFVMSLIPGFVNNFVVIVCLIISVVFVLLFLLSKDR